MDLNEIRVFVAIVKHNNFSKAALSLGVPKSYVSRKLTELEERLKVRLLQRTTRSVALTPEGQQYYDVCSDALDKIHEAELSFAESHAEPTGHIRLTCPVEFGPALSKKLTSEFLLKFPMITLEVLATNTVMDLAKSEIDVAIRPSQLATQDMISRKLGELTWHLYAAPKWYQVNSHIAKNPETLRDADLIAFNPRGETKKSWSLKLQKKDKAINITYKPRFIAGNLSVLMEAVQSGCGIASLPDFLAEEQIKKKQLRPILPDWYNRHEEIYAVYLARKHLPAKTRAILDYLASAQIFKT